MSLQHADSLRTILDTVFSAPAYRWVQRKEPLSWLANAWLHLKEWFLGIGENHPLAARLVLYLLAVGMVALVVHALLTFLRGIRHDDATQPGSGGARTRRDEAWYRGEADRLAASGRFAEAVQADFLALVLALDARRALRFHPSKTPAEYARESQLGPGARDDFRDLVRRLYAYAFARIPCGAAEFADWRARAAPERYAPAN